MEQSVESLKPRKRSARDLDPLSTVEASSKRSCTEASSASAHFALLKDLYGLETDEDGPAADGPLESSTQEDLVAEMMKSLEKVIEETECRVEGGTSTSTPTGVASPDATTTTGLDFTWSNEELEELRAAQNAASFHGELVDEEDLKVDAQIKELLQASDDELGVPMSSSSSDLEENAFHEEWASLANENGPENFSWLVDASLHQFEDSAPSLGKEIFEPLLLF